MKPSLRDLFKRFLEEDLPFGDLTSELLLNVKTQATGEITAKEEGVLSGVEFIASACEEFCLTSGILKRSGERIAPGDRICTIDGDARTILALERTVLNLLGRLSGVATATARALRAVREVNATTRIAGTRKTTPGLRELEKEAIRHGGGDTHRFSLSDMILIKDNHVALAGGVRQVLQKALSRRSFAHKVEIEVTSKEDAAIAAESGADVVMLDNMSPEQVRDAISFLEDRRLRDRVLIEVSGGINEETVVDYASAGADILSIGALTHSTKSFDFSLNVVRP
jgi:nicotinate-nucleotide pyrophosphorylase (carboxylating)